MADQYIFFGIKSFLGVVLFCFLIWRPITRNKKILRYCLLGLSCTLLLVFLAGETFIGFFWDKPKTQFQVALLSFAMVLWPIGFGFSWRWKPVGSVLKNFRIFCLGIFGIFVGINLWLPIPSLIVENQMPHEVKVEKDSPKGGFTATVFFRYGPSMFNDGETYLNLRPKGTPFKPVDYFRREYLEGNPANIMVLTGYDAHYEPVDLQWLDETHLRVLVTNYGQLSKNTINDYMNNYAVIFDKKQDRWKDIAVEYVDLAPKK